VPAAFSFTCDIAIRALVDCALLGYAARDMLYSSRVRIIQGMNGVYVRCVFHSLWLSRINFFMCVPANTLATALALLQHRVRFIVPADTTPRPESSWKDHRVVHEDAAQYFNDLFEAALLRSVTQFVASSRSRYTFCHTCCMCTDPFPRQLTKPLSYFAPSLRPCQSHSWG
jgi:hypothetical protein